MAYADARFGDLTNVKDLDLLVEQRHSKSTTSVFKGSENVLRAYIETDTEYSVEQLCDGEVVSVVDLDFYLRRFFVNARKPNVERYCRKSMFTIRFGLQKFFKRKRDVDIINDDRFLKSRDAFKAVLVTLKHEGKGNLKHKYIISEADIEKMYNSDVFSVSALKTLQNKVFFDCMLHFCNRGRENRRTLRKDDFDLQTDATGRRFITMKSKLTKNTREDDDDLKGSNRIYEDKVCSKMAEGAYMMIVDNHPMSYSSVQSFSHYMQMPTLIPSGRVTSPRDVYKFDLSLLPPTIDAIVDVLKYFQWNSVVYYVWDTDDGLLRLQKLYHSFADTDDHMRPIIRARQIHNVSNCYEVLRRIDHQYAPPKRIILDLSSREAYEKVLHQVVDVGMNREGYHYILGSLGIDELDLNTFGFVYGGVNFTGFSIVDNASRDNLELIEKATNFEIHELGKITTDEALVIDTVHVLQEAVEMLHSERNGNIEQMPKSRNRNRYMRAGYQYHEGTCCNCSVDPVKSSFDGQMLLNKLKQVKVYGLTGNVEFDADGIRQNYVFKVHQLEHKKPLRHVGYWTPKGGFNTSLPKLERPQPPTYHANRTLRITTIMEEPFVQEKKSTESNGAPLVDGKYLEGYCIDIAAKVHEASETPYEYYMDLVRDSSYGKSNRDKGCWDGMIGELIDDNDCKTGGKRPRADIAIAPLTITEERQRVVDFTKPYMQTGISIMIKKPDKEKPGVFSFMYPLSNTVWLCVMIAFVAVSLVLFLVGRWSPYEWTDVDPKGGPPINNFTLFNTFWFSLGALMQQGSDTFPRSYSGRVVGSAWWFFTLILISSYTANLAAFLTIERLLPPIKSVDDLVNQNEIEYGSLKSGTSRLFFEMSKVDVYKRMWQFMSANEDRVLKKTVSEGVEKVRNSKGKFAFLMESTYNMYQNQRKPCNTMKVGDNLDSKGYGIATPLHFPLRNELNLAVLHLREIGELHKLKQKWWYAKGMCGTDSNDATTSALTLSNVSGIFHILVGGLVLAMVVALLEYILQRHIRMNKKKLRALREKPTAVRIVKKQTLEALKEVGYSERENTVYSEYTSPVSGVAAPLVTFESATSFFSAGQPLAQ